MGSPVVALLTDYGLRDPYVAQVKAVILSYRRDVVFLDVSHEVEAFNELEAAFLLTTYAPHMPEGTIHVCIIDPGVGAGRRGITLETGRGDIFIGPDTGFMAPAAELLGLKAAYLIDESRLPPRVSETFHGRDVFAHVAGRLASGARPEDIGPKTDDYARLELPKPVVREGCAEAIVMHVDRFGNLITNLRPEHIPISFGDMLEIQYRGKRTICPFAEAYGKVGEGMLLVTVGGAGHLELSVNRGSAAERLGLRPGDRLRITLVEKA